MIAFKYPYKIVSEANTMEHWSVRHKRRKLIVGQLQWDLHAIKHKVTLPAKITLIRIAPRPLDEDNLVSAFKHVRDKTAAILLDDLRPGRADNDPRLSWNYTQEKGKPKEYAYAIQIHPAD